MGITRILQPSRRLMLPNSVKRRLRNDTISDQEVIEAIRSVPAHFADNASFFCDTKPPFLTADQSNVTLATTQKTLWAVGASSPTILPANYWTVGKLLRLTAYIKWTTGTAGNLTFGMCYGSADAPACNVVSAARAKIASVGPFGCFAVGYARCRSIGTAGTLSMFGMFYPSLSVMLSTAIPITFPDNGTTVVSTIDTTVGTNALSFQAAMSAGTDTMATTEIILEVLN